MRQSSRLSHGRRRRVFCGSLMDIFDNAVPLELDPRSLCRDGEAGQAQLQLLTKRIGNVEDRILHTGPAPGHRISA